jgi:hypothetical protein
LIIFALPIVALICVAAFAVDTDAALIDFEPPFQYQDFDDAYVLTTDELGQRLEIQRNGGGDFDYLKLPFVNTNDIITVNVSHADPDTYPATIEYWVSDPNLFPIYTYDYQGDPNPANFTFTFAVTVAGSHYIHTGIGLGDTYINMTINRIPVNPPPQDKDSNNMPLAKVLLTSEQTHREDAGLPWDPSDFFYINIQPNLNVNKYLTIEVATSSSNSIQWELYDTTGIQRPSLTFSSDTIIFGETALDGTSRLQERRIEVSGDYILRIWMKEGFGQYNLTLTVLSYPNDQDNSIDEATTVVDGFVGSGDVNLSFDRGDYYEIYLEAGEPLWVVLQVINGPADLFILDEDKNQKAASRKSDLETDHIDGWKPEIAGLYFIVIEAVYEAPNWENPPTVDYDLEVWINYDPEVNTPVDQKLRNYHLDEDTVNTDYDVTVLFKDADGDVLTYDLDMSYNNSLIDIQLGVDDMLRIEPIDNASEFKIQILLNATDPHGLWVNYSVTIWVDPINDGPFVDTEDVPDQIDMGEDLVKSGVNVTKAFRDVDDDYDSWTFTATSTDHIMVELDEDTWLATFTPKEENWWGIETFTVVCTDSGDLTAAIIFTIDMQEINDPPVIKQYIQAIEMLEEATETIDLEDSGTGNIFEDVEGKDLTYKFDDNGSISVTISGSIITFTGQKDFIGSSTVDIWAEDDLGAASDEMRLFFTVLDVNDPPELDNVKETATVQEGDSIIFAENVYYTFSDEDSNPLSVAWNWYLDGDQVPPSEVTDKYAYEYVAPVTAEKERDMIVKLEIIDGDLDPVSITWTISITNKNEAPDVPVITSTGDKKEFKEGDKMEFSATGTDLDNDLLTFTWFLDELEEVGEGPTVSLKNVKPGTHKVSVEVTDESGATNRQDFEFNVKKDEGGDDSPGFGSAYLILALIGVVAVMALIRRRQ